MCTILKEAQKTKLRKEQKIIGLKTCNILCPLLQILLKDCYCFYLMGLMKKDREDAAYSILSFKFTWQKIQNKEITAYSKKYVIKVNSYTEVKIKVQVRNAFQTSTLSGSISSSINPSCCSSMTLLASCSPKALSFSSILDVAL